MAEYFPDKYPKGRCCDRDYMFNVANTLHEEIVTEVVQHALKQRHAVDSIKLKDESVLISDYWTKELKSLPMVTHVSATHFYLLTIATVFILYRKKDVW